MEPILILQHMRSDGPGYFGTFLTQRGVPHEVRDAASGQTFPDSMAGYSALAVLGGAMSANDPLPFLAQGQALIRECVVKNLPVIGHCLGGQLLAKTLGARVASSRAPEIGWQPMRIERHPLAQSWLGPASQVTVMHWHYEAFELPAQAQRLATSAACANQAFVLGPHLGMQFHIEIDAPKLDRWLMEEDPQWAEARASHPASVQDEAGIRDGVSSHMGAHQALAEHVYGRWLGGVQGV